jgi:hypothetical protein
MCPAQSNGFTRSAIATMATCGLPQWARTLTGRRPVWKGRKKTEETRLWLLAIYSPVRLADLHAAIEEGAVPNTDALCDHIPDQGTFTAHVHTVAGIDVAAYLAQNHHFTSRDVRRHLCVAANGDPASRLAD